VNIIQATVSDSDSETEEPTATEEAAITEDVTKSKEVSESDDTTTGAKETEVAEAAAAAPSDKKITFDISEMPIIMTTQIGGHFFRNRIGYQTTSMTNATTNQRTTSKKANSSIVMRRNINNS
jgi:hypothetical protein